MHRNRKDGRLTAEKERRKVGPEEQKRKPRKKKKRIPLGLETDGKVENSDGMGKP